MLKNLDALRDLTMLSLPLRLFLSFICGSAVGVERTFRNKPAGIRTHSLICMASCIASVTGFYLYLNAGVPADPTRIGAQVISGLGFIGAGTIMVTKRNTVKGLATAAGMWASGIIGLSAGAGFYEGAVIATVLVVIVEVFSEEIRHRTQRSGRLRISVMFGSREHFAEVLNYCQDEGYTIISVHVNPPRENSGNPMSAHFSLRPPKNASTTALIESIGQMEGIQSVIEL